MNRHYRKYIFAALIVCIFLSVSNVRADGSGLVDVADQARSCGVFSELVGQLEASVVDGTLSQKNAVSLLSPLVDVCLEKLPLAPFEDKLTEGLAKRVAPPFIVRALNKKMDEYKFARDLLQQVGDVNTQAIVIMGEGLSKGAPRQDFENYVSSYGDKPFDSFLVGMEMTSFLSQSGFDYRLTSSMLDAGFSSGSIMPQWRYFIRIVLVARQRGLSDSAIAKTARTVLADGGSPSEVPSLLGFTSRDLTGYNNSN
jgi:hypothetical protein